MGFFHTIFLSEIAGLEGFSTACFVPQKRKFPAERSA
jgi:hypothetical protein